ncbi:interleukin-like EMT inducer domain-containing protein, partial [Lactococcus cremoris]|uniref:interleukin-like EMT inducer domain-containing protein n=1 Tax=Lactococcus lactis subsp. cremoris TaxID=1359 RepID=UPI0035CB7A64
DARGIDGKAVYAYKATVNEKVVGTASVTITNVNDGERGPQGLKGDPGATGKDGVAGKDGVGIKNTVITYAISTSGTTAPNTSWTSSVPSLVKGQYLWTKTVWTYTDSSSETGYSVTYIAKDGNNGNDGIAGKDGVGIKTTTITYAGSTSGTTAPTTGWTAQVPTVPAGQFLWTKTVWTYTDNSSETGYSVAMMGLKGDKGDPGNNGTNGIAGKDGKGIKATAITYQASSNGTTAPTGTWSASVPTVAKGSFLWTRTIWTYTDNTTETGYAVAYMGTNGNNGTNGIAGKDGTGIKTTTITYAVGTSGTTAPASGWNSQVPNVPGGQYLWTKTVWDYTDKTSETGYSVSKFGEKGDRGDRGDRGIQGLQGPDGTQGIPGPKGVDGTDAPTITVKSYTYSAGSRAEIELTGPNAFKKTVYNRGHNVWVIDATTHELKEFVNCDTYNTMSFSHNGVNTTLADYLASLKDSIVVIAASDADSIDQNVRDVLNSMGGFPDLGTWGNWRVGHVFIGMSKRNDGTWPLQPRQGYEESIIKDGSAPEIGCTLSKGGIVANGADGKTQYTHIAYANSADGKTDFSTSDSNRTYIGMYVDFNINDSNTPSDYSWTLVKGSDGTQGTPGKAGADGKTPYFHTAYAYSADGTDRFTTVYPKLNLFEGSRKYTKDNPRIQSSSANDGWTTVEDVIAKNLKAGTYTMSGKADAPWTVHDTSGAKKGKVGLWLVSTRWEFISLGDTVPKKIEIPKDGDYFVRLNTYSNGKDIETHKFWDFKLEPGSIATPYMPSSSEVTTADYPSYIGQYTDFTQADSTNPSAYTWSLIRGNDGKDGATGKDGVAGKDGVGIKTTVITYQASTNGTTAPTGTWSASVPTVAKGSFLWTRTIWTYTDNTTETGYAVAYMGTNGNNGTNGIAGKDGTGIKTTTITYAGSTSGTTAPSSGWTSTVPTVAAGSYLWTKTLWTYTDNSFETGYSVGKMGNTGPAGSTGNPGKIVSDTEPTTKFKGLTWKYSGVVDMTLGNGTKILAGTEYYWDGTVWALYEINAHNINGDNLSVTNGTFKDGKIESIWGSNGVNGTTTIEGSHLQFHSSDSTTNTENTLAIDNRQGYAQVYTERNTGRAITVQASFQGFFVSDSTGPFVRVTPNGIKTSSDKSYNSFQIGAGITINLERRGDIVEATLSGSINYPLTSNTKFSVGLI